MTTASRKLIIRTAGVLFVLLAFGSALLPTAQHIPARTVIGLLLIAAGGIEFPPCSPAAGTMFRLE